MSDSAVDERRGDAASGASAEPGASGPGFKLPIPTRSVVRTAEARRALDAIARVVRMESCLSGYSEAEDAVRRALLALYGRLGRAPTASELAEESGCELDAVAVHLARLERRDLVLLDPESGAVTGAYPFRESDTGHRVRLGERRLNAMCAIDALGAGAMYDRDVAIDSACRECGAPIHVATAERGTLLRSVSPEGTVVWSGLEYDESCMADSLCRVLAFFCGDDHLSSWRRANHPDVDGFRLSPEEALEVGRGIFTDMLAPAVAL